MTALLWRLPELDTPRRDVTITPREADVLTGICMGLSSERIGARLHISEDTVKSHLKTLYKKLGARDRCHAVSLTASGHVTVTVDMTSPYHQGMAARMQGGAA